MTLKTIAMILLTVLVSGCTIGGYELRVSKVNNNVGSTGVVNDQVTTNDINYPKEYHIRIVHVGGADVSDVSARVLGVGDGEEWFMNEPDYLKSEWMPYYMNNGGYLIGVSCHQSYDIKDCWSDSVVYNKTTASNDGYCQFNIEPQKVYARVECVKK